MLPDDLWSPSTNFVEIGSKDGAIGASLVSYGFGRLLVIARSPKQMASIEASHRDLGSRLTCSTDTKVVRHNNADVLILSGRALFALWNPRNWRHAQHIAWTVRLAPSSSVAVVLCLVYVLIGHLRWKGLVNCGAATGRLAVLEVRRRRASQQARRYIPFALGVVGFLKRLRALGVRHAVLRWFDSLPDLPPGEDIDLLIDDDHLESVHLILAAGPGIQAVDVYSVTGLPGAEYANMPYFPPRLAEEILAEASPYRGICLVPSPRHHFLSLAYHALYHKGERSGLPSTAPLHIKQPEHDYAATLRALAGQLSIDVPITLEDLDRYLDATGWRPPRDMLARLALRNRWLGQLTSDSENTDEDSGLSVFVIRQEGLKRNGLERISSLLQQQGFEILATKLLSERESRQAASCIRGGNWGRGPWKVSGGPPAAVVVTYDSEPIKPTSKQRRQFPRLANARTLVKSKIRDALNRELPEAQRCNVLHSSDNGREARDYLHVLIPEAAGAIQQRVRQIQGSYATEELVLKTITRFGRRAKIEIVELNGQLAVKKTFKPHQLQFCTTEANALAALAPSVPEVPPLLRADRYSLLIPYYDDVLQYKRSSGKLFPLKTAKQAIKALQKVYDAGYALIDAHVENVLIDRKTGLKLIDFEFCYRYDRKPTTFEQSYDIAGCPADFRGNLPDGGSHGYSRGWQPYVGLSLSSLLHDPTWLQYLKRSAYYLVHLPRFLPRRFRHGYRFCQGAIAARWRGHRAPGNSPRSRQHGVSPAVASGAIANSRATPSCHPGQDDKSSMSRAA